MIDLAEFLSTGELGNYELGQTYHDFVEESGSIPEENKYFFEPENPEFGFSCFVNGVELIFRNQKLYTISLDPARLSLLLFDSISINNYTNFDKFLMLLTLLKIDWGFISEKTFHKQIIIQTKAGVQISFIYDEGAGMLLSRIQNYLDD